MTSHTTPATRAAQREEMARPAPGPDEVHVTTDRLLLRRFCVTDAAALLAMDADPAVRRFVEDGSHPTLTSSRLMIASWLARYEPGSVYGFWAAIERGTGAFVGWFHLRPCRGAPDDEPELGYRLVAGAWGCGYATEGAHALIDRAFASGRAWRVVAETMVVHHASRRVMEKVGLRHVRTFRASWPVRIPGDEHGDVQYAITRDDWQRTRPRRGTEEQT